MLTNQLRLCLKTVGYGNLVSANSHAQALERVRSRRYHFILFEARGSDMAALEFVAKAIKADSEAVLVAVSANPRIDDVFGLLRAGARGFLATPFTADILEDTVQRAMEGPPFSDAVLQAPDRNAALAGVVLNNLYRLTVLMRQAREFDSAKREAERMRSAFAESIELARIFCEAGDENGLIDRIMEDCIARASAAASRLGRTRQRLKQKRGAEPQRPGAAGEEDVNEVKFA